MAQFCGGPELVPGPRLRGGYVIFDVRQNRYRLVTVIHYAKTSEEKQTEGHVYIRSLLTHKEYENHSNWDRRFGTK
jgi:mRNA interferase HigB